MWLYLTKCQFYIWHSNIAHTKNHNTSFHKVFYNNQPQANMMISQRTAQNVTVNFPFNPIIASLHNLRENPCYVIVMWSFTFQDCSRSVFVIPATNVNNYVLLSKPGTNSSFYLSFRMTHLPQSHRVMWGRMLVALVWLQIPTVLDHVNQGLMSSWKALYGRRRKMVKLIISSPRKIA